MLDFGIRLKELRIKKGLTQEQRSEPLGVTKSVVSYYESNKRVPSPEVLVSISHIFHVSADYLLDLDDGNTISLSGLDRKDAEVVRRLVAYMRAAGENADRRKKHPEDSLLEEDLPDDEQ